MKRAIEFEERVRYLHQVVVEFDDEETLDEICELTPFSFDDLIYQIENKTAAKILDSSEEYSFDDDGGLEYYDDYWTSEEEKRYEREISITADD